MAWLGILTVVIGFAVGCFVHDFEWFARSGAVLVALGITVLSRTFLAGTELHPTVIGHGSGLSVYSRAHYVKLGEPIPEWVYEQERNLFALGKLGPGLSWAGTIIWGFGDLLNKLLA